MELNKIYNEDSLIGMNRIPDKSVDMILCDLPYGTTSCKWDVVIPFKPLWVQYERVIKDNGAIVLTGSQPFTTDIINSNRKIFRYELIWEKSSASNFLDASKKPLKAHENILVFYRSPPIYNPQKWKVDEKFLDRRKNHNACVNNNTTYGKFHKENRYVDKGERYPLSVISINNHWSKGMHPNQKPVPLFSYLIRTYTNPGDLVLDNCMGSGTTAISCIQEGRNYIGFEWSPSKPHDQYYKEAIQRIEKELSKSEQLKLIV